MQLNVGRSTAMWTVPVLDVVASLVALSGLLPVAGGLPSIASNGEPLTDWIWLTANLGGALLLLAGGVNLLLRRVRGHRFAFAYSVLIAVIGTLRLHLVGFQRLISGWLL